MEPKASKSVPFRTTQWRKRKSASASVNATAAVDQQGSCS